MPELELGAFMGAEAMIWDWAVGVGAALTEAKTWGTKATMAATAVVVSHILGSGCPERARLQLN
jgi:hypothetical protein